MNLEIGTVTLQMGSFQGVRREAVWSENHTHLLYTKWSIGFMGHYGGSGYPQATSITRTDSVPRTRSGVSRAISAVINVLRGRNVAVPNPTLRDEAAAAAAPSGSSGFGPILTDRALHTAVMKPRQNVRIWGYDSKTGAETNLLQSPSPGFVCDPINGPHIIACDILDGNDNGFAVFVQLETATLPCDAEAERFILSHEWTQTHTHDDSQYLTIITEGELVLNGSMVHTFGVFADQFRSQFFHPIPLGFERKIPMIAPSSDGLSYKYRIEDVSTTITFDPGNSGATHMEIVEKMSYSQPWKILGSAGIT